MAFGNLNSIITVCNIFSRNVCIWNVTVTVHVPVIWFVPFAAMWSFGMFVCLFVFDMLIKRFYDQKKKKYWYLGNNIPVHRVYKISSHLQIFTDLPKRSKKICMPS